MMFTSEHQMSSKLVATFGDLARREQITIIPELSGLAGRPDFVLMRRSDDQIIYVIALELKLRNWKKALSQAIKYRNFSNEAYVIMPSDQIEVPLRNQVLFQNSTVGLAAFDEQESLKIHIPSLPLLPMSLSFSNRFANAIVPNNNRNHLFQRSINGRVVFNFLNTVF